MNAPLMLQVGGSIHNCMLQMTPMLPDEHQVQPCSTVTVCIAALRHDEQQARLIISTLNQATLTYANSFDADMRAAAKIIVQQALQPENGAHDSRWYFESGFWRCGNRQVQRELALERSP